MKKILLSIILIAPGYISSAESPYQDWDQEGSAGPSRAQQAPDLKSEATKLNNEIKENIKKYFQAKENLIKNQAEEDSLKEEIKDSVEISKKNIDGLRPIITKEVKTKEAELDKNIETQRQAFNSAKENYEEAKKEQENSKSNLEAKLKALEALKEKFQKYSSDKLLSGGSVILDWKSESGKIQESLDSNARNLAEKKVLLTTAESELKELVDKETITSKLKSVIMNTPVTEKQEEVDSLKKEIAILKEETKKLHKELEMAQIGIALKDQTKFTDSLKQEQIDIEKEVSDLLAERNNQEELLRNVKQAKKDYFNGRSTEQLIQAKIDQATQGIRDELQYARDEATKTVAALAEDRKQYNKEVKEAYGFMIRNYPNAEQYFLHSKGLTYLQALAQFGQWINEQKEGKKSSFFGIGPKFVHYDLNASEVEQLKKEIDAFAQHQSKKLQDEALAIAEIVKAELDTKLAESEAEKN